MQLDLLSLVAHRLAPIILLLYVIFICLEMALDRLFAKNLYHMSDTIQNLSMFFVNRMTGGLAGLLMIQVLDCAYIRSPWKCSGIIGYLFTFLLVDFLFFVQHYCFHHNAVLSAFHEVHHTSKHYNLTTTLRASFFLPWINPLFYLPAAFLGCEPLTIVISFGLIQVFQFFLHTELIPTLGPCEGLVNTPSAHRVHHGLRRREYTSNLGGVFLIWDRLCNSYLGETQKVHYGVKGVGEENLLVAQVRPFYALGRRWSVRNSVKR